MKLFHLFYSKVAAYCIAALVALFWITSIYIFAQAIRERDVPSCIIGLCAIILGGLALIGSIAWCIEL